MTLAPGVAVEIERRLGAPLSVSAVGGGCIHPAFRVAGAGGQAFLKTGGGAPAEVFEVEAAGLRWLRERAGGAPRVPDVLARGGEPEPWLLLEWLQPGTATAGEWAALGRDLARLHRSPDGGWGWERSGFIGSLRQENGGTSDWASFWQRHRLEPQRRRAARRGLLPGRPRDWEALGRALPAMLEVAEREGPSPLHGDLWSGNAHPTEEHGVALLDPAPYRGHREVDLAMARLFGGFPEAFFQAYEEEWPLRRTGERQRRACYQLYFLLVHVNLFGQGYVRRAEQALGEALAT